MTHQHGRTLTGHRRTAWSIGVIGVLIMTGLAGVAPAQALASETPTPTWGTGPMPPSNPSGSAWQGGRVHAITRANGRIYLGGAFTQAVAPDGSTPVARPGLIALDAATGQFDAAFDAHANGTVFSLAASPDGRTIYVGGQFTSLGGTSNRNLAAVDSATGLAVPGWTAGADQAVLGLAVSGDRVYAGGKFNTITDASGPKPRAHVVALNAADGSVLPGWSGAVTGGNVDCGRSTAQTPPYVRALTVSADGGRLLIGGCFLGLNSTPRNHLGALAAATGTLDSTFRPLGGREVYAVATDSTRVYAAQGGGGGEGTAFDASTGRILWSVHGDGNFQGLAVSGGLVYFGGHFGGNNMFVDATGRNYDRNKLAAVYAATGAIHPFAAHTNSPLGIFVVRNSGNFLDIGGDFTLAGPATNMEKVAHFAQFPVSGSAPGAPTSVHGLPGDGAVTLTWTAPDGGGSPIIGYTVTPWTGDVAGAARPFSTAATTQTITGLSNGTTYTFTVAARNQAGLWGPASDASAPLTPAGTPVTDPPTTTTTTATTTTTTTTTAPPDPAGTQVLGAAQSSGYWLLGAAGTVYPFGEAILYGAPAPGSLSGAAEDLQATPSGEGYWIVDTAGQVQAFGDARWLGNADRRNMAAGEQVTSLASTLSGNGYWLFTSQGRVFARGDARHLGDMAAVALNGPVLDSIATPSGNGYYMVAGDGGIFAFGDAAFSGSMGGRPLNSPVQSAVPDPDGAGYWLVGGDGGVFAIAAPFLGSAGALRLNSPVTGMVSFGNGYLLVGSDGGVFNYSDLAFSGSLADAPPTRPIVSVAALS